MRQLTGAAGNEDLRTATARKLGVPKDSLPVMNLQWLGMFSDRSMLPWGRRRPFIPFSPR